MSGFGEIVGIVSAVAALAELSGKILRKGYSYTTTALNASIQLRQLLSEVSSLDVLLNKISDLANNSPASPTSILAKVATNDRWKECETLLEDVMKVISKCEPQEGHVLANAKRRARWPLEKKETMDLMQNLQRLRSYFDSAIAIDTAAQVGRAVEGIQTLRDTEEFHRYISWICPTDVDDDINLYHLQQARHPGTCQWLLDSPVYTDWRDGSSSPILWINGPPGSGKTVMSAVILQNLEKTFLGPDQAVIYFSLDHRDSKKQSLSAILGWVIKQLLNSKPEGIKYVKSTKEASDASTERVLNTKIQMDLLTHISEIFRNVFLVIDALDESASAKETDAIIDCLSYLTRAGDLLQDRTTVSVCCTSRRLVHIERRLKQFSCRDVCMDSKACPEVHRDIRTYIMGQVASIISTGSLSRHSSQPDVEILKNRTVELVTAKADGLFLQAKCHLDLLSDAPSIKIFRTALGTLPNGLVETYDLILRQIRQRHSRYMTEILRMLRWIAGVREPTTLAALAQVAVIEPEDTSLDVEAIWLNVDELLLMLSGLITVDYDHRPPIVRFSHSTVKEYLQSRDIQASAEAEFYIDPQTIDREIARVCLQYLSFDQFAEPDAAYTSGHDSGSPSDAFMNALSLYVRASVRDRIRRSWTTNQPAERAKDLRRKLDEYPLLAYASLYWIDHVNDSGITTLEFSELTPGLGDWLCDAKGKDPRFLNWAKIHCSVDINAHGHQTKQPPLYFALLFGVLPWVESLATQTNLAPSNWTTPFGGGWCAITLAAASRSVPTVDVVLARAGLSAADVLALVETTKNRTALHVAAELGDAEMIKHLLRRGASPWALTRSGTTPLYRAAVAGSTDGLTALYESVDIGRRVEYVNLRTWDNWTALMNAVLQGRSNAVSFLLEHGADCTVTNRSGQTALSISVMLRYKSIQTMLLRKMGLVSVNGPSPVVESSAGYGRHDTSSAGDKPNSLKQRLLDATTLKDRSEMIQDALRVKLGRILGVDVENMDVSASLIALGVDSLSATEVRSWFLCEIEADITVLSVLTNTVGTICDQAAADFSD